MAMNKHEQALYYLQLCLEQVQEYSPNELVLGREGAATVEEIQAFIDEQREDMS